jgi:hypothetical protein
MICLLCVVGGISDLENRIGLLPYSVPQLPQATRNRNTSFVDKFSRTVSTNFSNTHPPSSFLTRLL